MDQFKVLILVFKVSNNNPTPLTKHSLGGAGDGWLWSLSPPHHARVVWWGLRSKLLANFKSKIHTQIQKQYLKQTQNQYYKLHLISWNLNQITLIIFTQ